MDAFRLLAVFAASALIIASACTTGGGTADQASSTAAVFGSLATDATVPTAEVMPPLRVVMAGGVSDLGEPVGPALAFAPTTPELTAVVAVPDVPRGSELSVEWRRMTAPGEYESLFTHWIPVRSGVRAYSVGTTDADLANGIYEIVASVTGESASVTWVVDGDHTTVPAAATSPPVSGASGSIDATAAGSAATGDDTTCDLGRLIADYEPLEGAEASVYWGVDEVCGPAMLAAQANGGEARLIGERPGPRYGWFFDPCLLPEGNDMPGTRILMGSWLTSDDARDNIASDTVELTDYNPGPTVGITTKPPPGSVVAAGQTVPFLGIAILMPPAHGITRIEVHGPHGLIAGQDYEALECDEARHFRGLHGTYAVPDAPPEVIELRVVAEDALGRRSEDTITLLTEQRWHGTMEAAGSYGVDLPEGSFSCDYVWSAEFAFTVDGSGSAAGTGSAAIDPDSSCIEVLAPVGYPGTTPISFEVDGLEDNDGFALVFTREMVQSFPYHILTANPETINIAKSDPCTAAASIEQGTEDFKRQAGVDGPGWDVPSTTHIELRCSGDGLDGRTDGPSHEGTTG